MKNNEKPFGIAAQLHAYQALKSRAMTHVTAYTPHPTTTDFFRKLMQSWKKKHAEKEPAKQLEDASF